MKISATLRLCVGLCTLCVGTTWGAVAPIDVEDAPAADAPAEGKAAAGKPSGPVVIARGDRWAPLAICREPVPGSALDFSVLGLQDAPAGKHGWLKNVNGHFEFEGLPGVPQRFYGANLCSAATFPDHETADRLVAALVRLGYNSIRIHHFDRRWTEAFSAAKNAEERKDLSANSASFAAKDNDSIDRLDYLLAKCYEAGIYVTSDLYTQRNVLWRDIGIDRDGRIDRPLYKTYVGLHDGAFDDWCRWTRDFLTHVNPYTGRANKDEPGMPFISLINEGRLHNGWEGKKDDPVVLAAWREFSGGDSPPPPCDIASVDPDDPFNRFDEWVNRRTWERCSSFVRSLGCRALLTNDNNGRRHGEGQGPTSLYDYVDSHSYVYVPKWDGKTGASTLRCRQLNPICHNLPNILFTSGWAKGASKPHTISEWNCCAPGRCRSASGLIYGALGAAGEFDALWRFAYAHKDDILVDPPDGRGTVQSHRYDVAANPDMAAADRAAACLFVRGDACASAAANDENSIRVDRERGTLAINTPRTCGGFAESGRIDAGPLSFEIIAAKNAKSAKGNVDLSFVDNGEHLGFVDNSSATPTTLWVSSLDGEPLTQSSRMLLSHVTDVQREGSKFADDTFGVMLEGGTTPLIEAGKAEVELRLGGGSGAQPPLFTVFSLDAAGNRTGEVPATFRDGVLRFTVSTIGPGGEGRIYYEIVRVKGAAQ